MATANDERKYRDMLAEFLKLQAKHPQWKLEFLYEKVAYNFYLSASRAERIIVAKLKGKQV